VNQVILAPEPKPFRCSSWSKKLY